jgi:hypothetical protein
LQFFFKEAPNVGDLLPDPFLYKRPMLRLDKSVQDQSSSPEEELAKK